MSPYQVANHICKGINAEQKTAQKELPKQLDEDLTNMSQSVLP